MTQKTHYIAYQDRLYLKTEWDATKDKTKLKPRELYYKTMMNARITGCDSEIQVDGPHLKNWRLSYCEIINLKINGGGITESSIKDSTIEVYRGCANTYYSCKISWGTTSHSTIKDSTVKDSEIWDSKTWNSTIEGSDIINSDIHDRSD